MNSETVQTSITVNAAMETVFDVLADPTQHAGIDGTGWVRESLDGMPLTEVGQIFRIEMYHDNHPNKVYDMSNRVEVFDRPRAIAWQPGQGPDDRGNLMPDADLEFGGWIWRYDLEPGGPGQTKVTLTYDWSRVPSSQRQHIEFPPFAMSHLENSLQHLAELAQRGG
ncbi:SRPBCC family protein [Mycobacterium sp. IDR2000157661]|uniref:SRPBCC family protein n=1 Tax=Mycobacterium sp. IDR2000157661 TaxID=2867005 RepID=UPI001EEB9207|nr:SRPBCC family protein [Mycobacterium sp. IDR2000157661]ULE34251.1 polyketide cyclase [Mycobacterium sp. IDR2000157661]